MARQKSDPVAHVFQAFVGLDAAQQEQFQAKVTSYRYRLGTAVMGILERGALINTGDKPERKPREIWKATQRLTGEAGDASTEQPTETQTEETQAPKKKMRKIKAKKAHGREKKAAAPEAAIAREV